MKTCRVVEVYLIWKIDAGEWSDSHAGHFTPAERALISIGDEAGWTPEPVWTL
jgi:hypothetical protein